MPCACFRKIMFRYLAFTVKDRWGRLGSRRCDSVHGLPARVVGFQVVGFREAGRGRCDSVRRAPARHCDLGFVRSKNRMRGWSHAYRSHARLEPRVSVACAAGATRTGRMRGWSHASRSQNRTAGATRTGRMRGWSHVSLTNRKLITGQRPIELLRLRGIGRGGLLRRPSPFRLRTNLGCQNGSPRDG